MVIIKVLNFYEVKYKIFYVLFKEGFLISEVYTLQSLMHNLPKRNIKEMKRTGVHNWIQAQMGIWNMRNEQIAE